jgi:hypothetical protein
LVSVLLAAGATLEVINPDPITEPEIAAFVAALQAESDPFRLLAD